MLSTSKLSTLSTSKLSTLSTSKLSENKYNWYKTNRSFRNFIHIKKRENRWTERRLFTNVPNNLVIRPIGYYRNRFKLLNEQCAVHIEKEFWPLRDFSLKKKVNQLVESLQLELAKLCSLDRRYEALKYVETFCFSLVVRLYTVEKLRTRGFRCSPDLEDHVMIEINDYPDCLELISATHPKFLDETSCMHVTSVMMRKEDCSKVRQLELVNLRDRVLQLQFLILIDPIVESALPEHFYGHRRGRSALQAVAFLSKSIKSTNFSPDYLVTVNVAKCFDFMSHDFILKTFPFPEKYLGLFHRWLRCGQVGLESRPIRLNSGVIRGSIIGPVICNFVLQHITKNFFDDKMFPKTLTAKNVQGEIRNIRVQRLFISHGEELIIKVVTKDEAIYAIDKLTNGFKKTELNLPFLSLAKIRICNLTFKCSFDWLGYTYLIIPKKELYPSNIASSNTKVGSSKLKESSTKKSKESSTKKSKESSTKKSKESSTKKSKESSDKKLAKSSTKKSKENSKLAKSSKLKENSKLKESSNEKLKKNSNKKLEENSNEKLKENSNEKLKENSNKKLEENSNKKLEENSNEKLKEDQEDSNMSILFNYISNDNYAAIKDEIKETIDKLQRNNVLSILTTVNMFLLKVASYYSFANNVHRLDYLAHFVDRCFWKVLLDKYKIKGLRRPLWVARQFFITQHLPKNPLKGQKWLLHCRVQSPHGSKRQLKTYWCVNVAGNSKMQALDTVVLPERLRQFSFYLKQREFEEYKETMQADSTDPQK
jgi:hypothetical protein